MNSSSFGKSIVFLILALLLLCTPLAAKAGTIPYEPMIDSTILDGPKADVKTAGLSMLTLVVSVAGIGLIIGVILRR